VARLIYSVIASLDGYVNDADGDFSWAMPDEEVHAFVNDEMRSVRTHLYGRRLYEVMQVWQTFGLDDDDDPITQDFGQLWRAADKVVYSSTLTDVSTPQTRLERTFDPDVVRRLAADAEDDVSVGGPGLAADALRAGLVDLLSVIVVPVVVGGGTPYLPDGLRLQLRLEHQHRFSSGFVALRYAVGH
jgi:dihydrofolate reductase